MQRTGKENFRQRGHKCKSPVEKLWSVHSTFPCRKKDVLEIN